MAPSEEAASSGIPFILQLDSEPPPYPLPDRATHVPAPRSAAGVYTIAGVRQQASRLFVMNCYSGRGLSPSLITGKLDLRSHTIRQQLEHEE